MDRRKYAATKNYNIVWISVVRATPVYQPQANISLVVGRPTQYPCKFGNPYGVDSGCKIYVALRIPTEANIGV